MQTLNILLQFILPHHAISRFMLWFTRIRFRPVKNAFTAFFLKVYKPDLSEAVSYPTPTPTNTSMPCSRVRCARRRGRWPGIRAQWSVRWMAR